MFFQSPSSSAGFGLYSERHWKNIFDFLLRSFPQCLCCSCKEWIEVSRFDRCNISHLSWCLCCVWCVYPAGKDDPYTALESVMQLPDSFSSDHPQREQTFKTTTQDICFFWYNSWTGKCCPFPVKQTISNQKKIENHLCLELNLKNR